MIPLIALADTNQMRLLPTALSMVILGLTEIMSLGDSTHYDAVMMTLYLHRFFIGYWILKRGWISILALFLFIAKKPLANN
jgi:hypothetical protein